MTGLGPVEFEALFRKEFRPMVFFALRYVKDPDVAEEITQEVFLGLWEKRATIDPAKPVRSYLGTAVRNRSLNYLRDNKKFSRDLLEQEGLLRDDGYEQTDRIGTAELKERIREATAELPEKCREIFLLSREENLKYHEIAQRQQISIKTVETQMSKALSHFRTRLAEFIPVILLFFGSFWK